MNCIDSSNTTFSRLRLANRDREHEEKKEEGSGVVSRALMFPAVGGSGEEGLSA